MLFHTWVFAVFLAVALAGHLALRFTRVGPFWLLVASYVFYGWWDPSYLLLILASTAIDYAVGLVMARSAHKRAWLVASIASNLGLLGLFKYGRFLTENLNLLLAGSGWQLPVPDLVLPVGISFFTFQSMSYTIDVYRGEIEPEPSFVRFAAFVALFPQLVAGPVERARDLLPQLGAPRRASRDDIAEALSLFLVGLFKKVALADWLALYVDRVYGAPLSHQGPALVLATVAFGWQIYFDFSGYTDMARGVARLFGIRLVLNFDRPYTAVDLRDFWRRWHISLSTWFRDYVYVPLGGNRHGPARLRLNLAATMLLSGLWHGADWGFVAWGGLHAVGRIATLPLERSDFYRHRVPRLVKQAAVFAFVTLAWVFFRARTWDGACLVLERAVTTGWSDPRFPVALFGLLLAVWVYELMASSGGRGARLLDKPVVRVCGAVFMIVWLLMLARPAASPFLYFQF